MSRQIHLTMSEEKYKEITQQAIDWHKYSTTVSDSIKALNRHNPVEMSQIRNAFLLNKRLIISYDQTEEPECQYRKLVSKEH